MREWVSRALRDEARMLWSALCDRHVFVALALLGVLLVLAAQAPLHYRIDIGKEVGVYSDRPLIRGFLTVEQNPDFGSFRWSSEWNDVRLPGIGQRPLLIELHVLGVNEEQAQYGAQEIEIWVAGREWMRLPVRHSGAVYYFALPAPPDGSGGHTFELRNTTFVPTGDVRALGVPVDLLVASHRDGLAWPAWRSSMLWLVATLLLWLAVRRAGFVPQAALVGVLAWIGLIGVAALLDPPRTAFGAQPAVEALGWGLALVIGLRAGVPALFARLKAPLNEHALRWLLLIVLLVFGLRYGGKIYPDSMPGDIGFHANRYADAVYGTILLAASHRGVDNPYPTALYVLLAPFSLLGWHQRVWLRLIGNLLDAISPLLVYLVAVGSAWTADQAQRLTSAPRLHTNQRMRAAIIAAGIYAFSAAGFMVAWWNFSTHIFAQFTHLLLITALVLFWRGQIGAPTVEARPWRDRRFWLVVVVATLLQLLVFLGHFGFWMNMSLLGAMVGAVTLLALVARRIDPWRAWAVVLSYMMAQGLAALFFYSRFVDMFYLQAQAAATGGLTGLASRDPIPFDVLWRTLWEDGLRTHFGLFLAPLALGGMVWLFGRTEGSAGNGWRKRPEHQDGAPLPTPQPLVLPLLMAGTFLIGLFFALLPFFTGSSLATRWLLFSAWAVAVGAALVIQHLIQMGRAGQLLALAIGGYVVWITLSQWLTALAWRVRPPEPF